MPQNDLSPIAQALGRVPSGLYVVTTREDGRPIGFVGSFVMQAGFEPPMITIAVAKDRPHLRAIRAHGRFAVSVLDKASRSTMGRFLKVSADPFEGLSTSTTKAGSLVLGDALAWIDCVVRGELDTGDHVIVSAQVVDAATVREGDPHVHLRKNGLAY